MIIDYYQVGAHGEIIGTGSCQENAVDALRQYKPGLTVGSAVYGRQYVDGLGSVRDLPEKPSPSHTLNYATKQWEPDPALAESQAKATRNRLLTASDWTQLPDVPLATKEAWATYRQALRDITAQPGYPFNVIWPQAPQ